ncbi:MICOS complex subunit [Caerostris extrusa]|uniref:MICOS complex subunit n=1 Tax=Caerostris extrusa TaxID=172846 RepID=A0AAV4MZH7_CAEEX|nr:MICOS complex subunit [Caerostris extrusa]
MIERSRVRIHFTTGKRIQTRAVISSGACISSIAVMYSISNKLGAKAMVDCHDCNVKRLPKAKELPLYVKDDENLTIEYNEHSKLPLISEISSLRVQVSGVASYLNVFKEQAVHIYETGLAHTQSTYDYIISEENKIPRILAIFSGGLLGIIFARKGGYIKKAFYGTAGSGVVCTAFYPTQSYDTQKLAEKTNEKIEYVKSTLKIEGLSNKLKELFDKNKETVSKMLTTATETNSKNDEPEKTSK